MLTVVQQGSEQPADRGSLLDEIARDGARAMLAAALQAEVAAFVDAHSGGGGRGPAAAGQRPARRRGHW